MHPRDEEPLENQARAKISSEQMLTVHAPAKLNLHLRILAREDSGYHTLETIFHKIALADDVRVALAPPGQETIHCTRDVGPPEQNLAFRAARAFCEATQWNTGFDINIIKRIPSGAGLGGGSADAAATLRVLNRLVPTPLEQSDILKIAGTLGADVPFLASSAVMALAWNRGDRMLILDPMPQRHVVLVVPDFSIHTAEAYKAIDRTARGTGTSSFALSHAKIAQWEILSSWAQNDFTEVVSVIHPSIATNIEALRNAGATFAEMTGSGSVVFGIFDKIPDTTHIARVTGGHVIVTQTAD